MSCVCYKESDIHDYLTSFCLKLHNTHTMITISSTIHLLIRFDNVSEKTLYSFILLMAFSTLILALAINLDCIPSCAERRPPLKKLGIVRKHLFWAKRSRALYPLSARILWPGLSSSKIPLCWIVNRSLLFPENPGDTKIKTPVKVSIPTKYFTVV